GLRGAGGGGGAHDAAGAAIARPAAAHRPRTGRLHRRPARRGRLRGLLMSGATHSELKLDLATRGIRIEPGARILGPSTEPLAPGARSPGPRTGPLPQTPEPIAGDARRAPVRVAAAGTAPEPFRLVDGERGGYCVLDARPGATPLPVQIAAAPRFYGRRTTGG